MSLQPWCQHCKNGARTVTLNFGIKNKKFSIENKPWTEKGNFGIDQHFTERLNTSIPIYFILVFICIQICFQWQPSDCFFMSLFSVTVFHSCFSSCVLSACSFSPQSQMILAWMLWCVWTSTDLVWSTDLHLRLDQSTSRSSQWLWTWMGRPMRQQGPPSELPSLM